MKRDFRSAGRRGITSEQIERSGSQPAAQRRPGCSGRGCRAQSPVRKMTRKERSLVGITQRRVQMSEYQMQALQLRMPEKPQQRRQAHGQQPDAGTPSTIELVRVGQAASDTGTTKTWEQQDKRARHAPRQRRAEQRQVAINAGAAAIVRHVPATITRASKQASRVISTDVQVMPASCCQRAQAPGTRGWVCGALQPTAHTDAHATRSQMQWRSPTHQLSSCSDTIELLARR